MAVAGALLVWISETRAGAQDNAGPPNHQSDPEFARIDRERGAVLCSWLILTELKAIDRRCHPGENPALAAALDRSLDRFHAFIAANGGHPRDQLEAAVNRRLSEAAETEAEPGLCEGDGEQFYRQLTRDGAAGIDEWTERTLAVPRPPVLNPCL
jgi:hypothetical protein